MVVMNMSNKFPGILITCDTREQSALIENHKTVSAIKKDTYFISDYSDEEKWELAKKRPRIYSIYDHFEAKGSLVGISKLDRCDYHIIGVVDDKENTGEVFSVSGIHRQHNINLGVEYKYLEDFMGSHIDLPWKLLESAEKYDQVALFIEGKIDIEQLGDFWFIKSAGGPSTLRYDLFQARVASWQEKGIHVRCFDSEFMFAPTLENLIDYCTKDGHKAFEFREECAANLPLKMLTQIPGLKVHTLSKLLADTPEMTMAMLIEKDMKWMQKQIGKKTGEMLWRILHDVTYKGPEKRVMKHENASEGTE